MLILSPSVSWTLFAVWLWAHPSSTRRRIRSTWWRLEPYSNVRWTTMTVIWCNSIRKVSRWQKSTLSNRAIGKSLGLVCGSGASSESFQASISAQCLRALSRRRVVESSALPVSVPVLIYISSLSYWRQRQQRQMQLVIYGSHACAAFFFSMQNANANMQSSHNRNYTYIQKYM